MADVRSEVLTIKIEPALKQRAREVAKAHGLTMSNFIHGALKAILSAYEPQPMRMLYDRLPSVEKSLVEKWIEAMRTVEGDVLCERCRPTFWNSPDTWYALSQKQMEPFHCIMCDENDPAAS